MSKDSRSDGPTVSHGGRDGIGNPLAEDGYLLSPTMRKSCKYAAVFVAYSQFASVAFIFAYRSQEAWNARRGYVANHGLFAKFLVPWLIFPAGKIGMLAEYPI